MSHVDVREQAIEQFLAITNGTDREIARDILESNEWDIHRAVDLVLSQPRPMQIDDSAHAPPPPRLASLSTILTFPLHILSNIFRFIFTFLRIPFPRLSFSSLSFYSPRSSSYTSRRPRTRPRGNDTANTAARWLRQLEEETGAVSIGTTAVAAATTATSTAGPSNIISRSHRSLPSGVKLLPDFALCTYDDALKTCQRDARIGCIILVSEEHDEVAQFKHSTLTDATLVNLLYDNNFLVWGGDVREHDAWSAAEKLQATTYPFVAFIALQPRRSPISSSSSSSSNSSPTLTVLSRHQGSSASPEGPTSAQTLTNHITNHLLPRITPFLTRIQSTRSAQIVERQIREQQDTAFREAAERDRIRIEEKMAQERREREEEERRRKMERLREEEKEKRMGWRRWIRRQMSSIQQSSSSTRDEADSLKIAVRLPTGKRIIQTFSKTTQTLTTLYAFVDAQLIPPTLDPKDDPHTSPSGDDGHSSKLETSIERHLSLVTSLSSPLSSSPTSSNTAADWWAFQLALAYPRKNIPWAPHTPLASVDAVGGEGGQVFIQVEMMQSQEKNRNNRDNSNDTDGHSADDDGYNTEEE